MRGFENLRRTLEDLYVKSTAQNATPEDQAVFTPELIAKVYEAAKQDNARMTIAWARAIYAEATIEQLTDPFPELRRRLLYARDQERSFTETLANIEGGNTYPTLSSAERIREAARTQRALRRAQEEILSVEKDLRDLRQSQAPVFGCPPQEGASGSEPSGHRDLDGHLPPVS